MPLTNRIDPRSFIHTPLSDIATSQFSHSRRGADITRWNAVQIAEQADYRRSDNGRTEIVPPAVSA
jgi:hypothetical protein